MGYLGHEKKETHRHDQNSNRISGNAGGEGFHAIYDNQDRLIRFNNSIYTYNTNGDLLSRSEKVKNSYRTLNFHYDVFGQLRQVGNISYETDLNQRRLSKKVNGVIERYYSYSPEGILIGEVDKDKNLIRRYVYGSKSHVPDYFIDQNDESYKLIVDHLGSVRLVVNSETGEILQQMHHDEFGRVTSESGIGFTPFGFAGGIYEAQTGLVRFGVRDYDPQTGRWTAKDPIRFSGGDTNLYGYVLQDPVNLIDPEGKSWLLPIIIGIIVILPEHDSSITTPPYRLFVKVTT